MYITNLATLISILLFLIILCPSQVSAQCNDFDPLPYVSTLCNKTDTLLTAPDGFVSYEWHKDTSSSDEIVGTEQSYHATEPGKYTIIVTDTNNNVCSDYMELNFKIVALEPYSPIFICEDNEEDIIIPGQSIMYEINPTYWWTDEDGNVIQNGNDDLIVTTSGIYTFHVINFKLCSTSESVEVSIWGSVNLGEDITVCDAETYTIEGPSGYDTYTWTDSNGNIIGTDKDLLLTQTQFPIQVKNANLEVTIADCISSDSINITFAQVELIEYNTIIICVGTSVLLEGGGSESNLGSYWSLNGSIIAYGINLPIDNLPIGNYEIANHFENIEGCSAETTYFIKVLDIEETTLESEDIEVCIEDFPLVILGPEDFESYLWSTGETTQNITVTQSGEYTLNITTADGCTATQITTVTSISADTFDIEDYIIDLNEFPIIVNIPSCLNVQNWSTGETSQSISINEAGNYLVTISDATGEIYTIEFSVIVITLSINAEIDVEPNQTTYWLSVNEGFNTYMWSTGETTPKITVTETGIYTVTVSYGKSVAEFTAEYIVPECTPTLEIESQLVCSNELPLVLSVPNNAENYIWSDETTEQNFEVNENGTYALQYNLNGECYKTVFDVNITPSPSIMASNIEVCEDDFPQTIDGPSGHAQYEWSTGETTENIEIFEPGDYTLTVYDINGCSGTATSIVSLMNDEDCTTNSQQDLEDNCITSFQSNANLVNETVVFEIPNCCQWANSINIFDIQGNQILQQKLSNETTIQLNVNSFKNGHYFVQLQCKKSILNSRFIKMGR